jgi:hypothetical protein
MIDESKERFATFEQLQKAHIEMMGTLKSGLSSSDSDLDSKARLLEFVKRVRNTGALIEDSAARVAAQNILDYWSAETVSIEDISGTDWRPEKLVPFDPSLAPGGDLQSAASPVDRQNARKKIQLAATARLWKDSGRAPGYLLNGSALQEAEKLAKDDREIEDLVAASKNAIDLAASKQNRNIGLLAAFVVLFAIIAWLVQDRANTQRALENQRADLIGNRAIHSSEAEIAQLKEKVKILTDQLKLAKLPVPTDVSEIVPEGVTSERGSAQSRSNPPSALQGFIWLGSETSPNFVEVSGGAAVKPTSAVVGNKYKVVKNLVLRTALPTASYLQSESAGVVPEQTVVTLRGIPVPYQRPIPPSSLAPKTTVVPGGVSTPSPAAPVTNVQYWAAVDVQYSDQPIVYVQYAGTNASAAQSLAAQLKARGFRVPGVETTDLAKGLNEIRYYYSQDKPAAEKMANALNSVLKDMQIAGLPIKITDLTSQKGSRNFPGVLELWIDLSSLK